MISTFKPKQRKCPICGERYIPCNPAQSCCFNSACALEKGRRNSAKKQRAQAKQERQEVAVRRYKLKTPSDRAKPAQASINRYANTRDAGKPCISCGKPDKGVRNASHFKSRGSNSALRFHLWNIHSSCYKCNCELSGNISEYRPRLVDRIGLEKVEFLENHPRSREYSTEYLKRITRIFNKKTKRLIKSRENTSSL